MGIPAWGPIDRLASPRRGQLVFCLLGKQEFLNLTEWKEGERQGKVSSLRWRSPSKTAWMTPSMTPSAALRRRMRVHPVLSPTMAGKRIVIICRQVPGSPGKIKLIKNEFRRAWSHVRSHSVPDQPGAAETGHQQVRFGERWFGTHSTLYRTKNRRERSLSWSGDSYDQCQRRTDPLVRCKIK